MREIRPGQPSLARIGALAAWSWRCPERFWMTALVESTNEVRLFLVQAPPSQVLDAGLEEIDPQPGSLAPQTFDRPGALCWQGG
ncbi:MAG: hypothetical protein H0W33_11490 [Gammaproteobacteria bacterium]|nr:hypothetical protein [Gammaproteobacteria bacterium]